MAIPLPWYPLQLPWQRDAASAACSAASSPPSGSRVCGHMHTHMQTHVRTHAHTPEQSRGPAWGVPQFPLILKPKARNPGREPAGLMGSVPRYPMALWATQLCPLSPPSPSPSRAGSVRGSSFPTETPRHRDTGAGIIDVPKQDTARALFCAERGGRAPCHRCPHHLPSSHCPDPTSGK